MRYLKALGVVLAIVLLGVLVGNGAAFRRNLSARQEQARAEAQAQGGAGFASMRVPAKAAAAVPQEVVFAGKPQEGSLAWSRPRGSLSTLKRIRSAEISIELKRYDEGAKSADAIAREYDGYVAESRSTSVSGEPAGGTLSIRIPAERFDEALRRLSELGTVTTRQVHTEDVTKQYFDLETRLRVERDAEARLRDVLRNRTAKLSDIVEAEQELTRIVGEIEQTEGERLFYDRQVAFCTIALEMHEPGVAPSPVTEPSPLQPIRKALHESQFLLATSAAGLISLAAAGLPWAGVLALLWALVRRIRSRRGIRLAV